MARILFLLMAMSVISSCTCAPSTTPSASCTELEPCGEDKAKNNGGLTSATTVQRASESQTLIDGKPADPFQWTASLYAKSGESACSATLVGERVLFIASHCLGKNGRVSFTAHANAYTARCTGHPEFKRDETADWALCLVNRPVTGIPFEVLGTDVKLHVGQNLLLSGYGCLHPGGGGGNDGIFRVGKAVIKAMPSKGSYDIVTKGASALCFGDSGGAAYVVTTQSRKIVGVNSRGDIETMSYLPSVSSNAFITWAKKWSAENANVRICGIHKDAVSCRGAEESLVEGKFELLTKSTCVRGVVGPEYLEQKVKIVESIRQSLLKFTKEKQ